jgi:phage terminase large subunit GpA-like protein
VRAEHLIRQHWRGEFYSLVSGWKRRVKRRPSVWAAEERYIAAGQSPLTRGQDLRWSNDVMPHAVEPMDAADDESVNIIVLWMARRMAKTEGVFANIMGRTVTDDPGNVYSMWPVEDSSERFSRDVIEPMIESCPSLRKVFVERKSRDSGRTIDYKRYHGGSIYLVNAGSKSKTRGMAAKIVAIHEADAFPVSSQGEGDPIEKAFGRAEGFGDAVKIIESTGTFAAETDPKTGRKVYRSNIEKWYDRSDQRKWFCPCRSCGREQWLKWDQIRELQRKSGETFFYLCEFCDADHNERQWRRLVSGGQWKPTAAFTGIRGYWINGFNSLLPKAKGYTSKIHQFAAEGNRALNGTPEEKQVWVNEVKAELWNPEEELEPAPPWKPIYDNRSDYGLIVPESGLFLAAGADCQLNRIEVAWRAFGREEESWGMDHAVLEGHIRHPEVWRKFLGEIARTFAHETGAEMRVGMCLIDGGAYQEDVYRFFQLLAAVMNPSHALHRQALEFFGASASLVPKVFGKVRASKGFGQHGHPIIDRKFRTIAKNLKGHHIGTWEAKDRIYERLRMIEGAEGRMHFNRQFSEEYFQQLTVETVVVTWERGMEVRKYVNPKQARNEALDMEVGCLAANRLHPRNLDALEAELKRQAEGKQRPKEQPKAAPIQATSMSMSGGGWKL